ncbi:uncharacterized protein GVI51_J03135 [Nakaseomyces glabratus]|uniref:Aminopeptidase P N-terminal domain-containing protein n=1 Tax=Candida glabrata (strain ATCC 2001 / BCRC 20586 / JCM 3761 / NBRC 0622 / NRRL Y-65 / CBS 138) TaxID=284593 RepID=Q6FPJ6_CANGA|nr:uncharacterized protein CAGL0J03300g [Nakaseomyces glabratus]KAH7599116.1 Aminopeptidase P and proline dipeptidase signature [Nakaseomyces glabratus]KAH7603694.1 Aminopeptidase P and proline dipeptidase signature [Nakaseomyces glabratus]QHS67501.1 uncharacterized protein GVI51_J03135 [Nakaseomyces glabratus]CAG60797.1 unnamed protein product [Nakaseomyces glabratus]|eukprot:XP_447848.1 uncharacterized protein CAGL0J03300g [[Candida] glabrata]
MTMMLRRYLSNGAKFVNRPKVQWNLGQRLHENRPFLLQPGELTPGITAAEYYQRRAELVRNLPVGSCLIILANQIKFASGAVFYPFQQDNDLFYLTGWNEPDSIMVLEKPSENIEDHELTMFVPPKNEFKEKWEGFRTGVDAVKEFFNADHSYSVDNSMSMVNELAKIIKRNKGIYFDPDSNKNSKINSNILNLIKETNKGTPKKLKSLVADLRKVKSESEIRLMRRAGQISGRSYNMAMAQRFRNERTLHTFLEHKFISGGCDKSAYIPVVATGPNALCIHYTSNDDVMYDDEMVLVDAAGALGGYCSDISRTWPVAGKWPSSAHKDLYEAVLNVQRESLKNCKKALENNMSLHDLHEASVKLTKQELKNLNFSKATEIAEKLYPHYIGHNLGLDVHDVPEVSRFNPLVEGQVITIEPGLYIPDSPEYPAEFRNIGIRIEDDVVLKKDGYINLTVEAVKEIKDIENVMQNGTTTDFEDDVVSPLQG